MPEQSGFEGIVRESEKEGVRGGKRARGMPAFFEEESE